MSKVQTPQRGYTPDWLQQLDGRTALAVELRQRQQSLTDDLGGADRLSYQQRALVDRALFLEFHLQQEELKLATGQEFDSGKWVQSCNALTGIFKTLGLNRQAKQAVDLNSYIKRGATA